MQGVRHTLCRELPGISFSGLGYESFPGIQQVLHVWGGSTWAGVQTGSMARPFTTISAALTASAALTPGAANRIMILVWPGTYDEALTAVAYVDIVGVDRDSCIVTQDTNDVLTDAVGNTTYRRLTFQSTGVNDVTNLTAAARVELVDCKLLLACVGAVDLDVCRVRVNGASNARFVRCVILNTTNHTWADVYVEGAAVVLFQDCTHVGRYWYLRGTSQTTISACSLYSVFGVGLILSTTTGTIFVQDSQIRNPNDHAIELNAVPTTLTLLGNTLQASSQYFSVYASVAITGARIENNVMLGGGIHANVSHVGPVKWVGASGDKDWYGTTQEALTACTYDDCVIKLLRDETLGAFLANPASRILTIDGHGKHRLTAPGGSGGTLAIFNSGSVTLRDLELAGRIYLSGGSVSIIAIERCVWDGMLDLFSTPAGSVARVTDSTIVGNGTLTYAISVGDADPQVVCKRSRLKGHTANPAIRWGIVNNNVDLKECTVMHGTPAVGNNPFGQSGGLGAIQYDAHQCAFNDDPDAVAGTIWTNRVPAGQRFHTIDPGADY